MKRTCVYVAGAYSADNVLDVLTNMRRGMDLSYQVLQAGFAPFCPWLDYHFALIGPVALQQYYDYSMAWLERSDAMLIQPINAATSHGTLAEIRRAGELGIPVFWRLEDLCRWRDAQI